MVGAVVAKATRAASMVAIGKLGTLASSSAANDDYQWVQMWKPD